jgi:hypothetical protein
MKKVYSFLFFFISVFIFHDVSAQLPELLPPPPPPPEACDVGGTYSVGPGGNYATITEALDSLRLRGVSTNVILELNASYSSDTEIFPITFPRPSLIPCYAGTFSLVLRPAAGVSNAAIHGASSNSIFLLDSCNYVTIDGRPGGIGDTASLTIINDSAAPAIRLFDASNNNILYTKLSGGIIGTSLYAGVVNVQGTVDAGCDNNKLQYCKLYSAVSNPSVKETLFYSSSSDQSIHNNSDSILNCEFYNYGKTAIQLDNYSEGWIIKQNSFYGASIIDYDAEVSVIKINTPAIETPHIIEGNFFGGTAPACQGGPMRISYKSKFYFIDINGQGNIVNNKFARLHFEDTVLSVESLIRLINITSSSNITSCTVNGNQFGSVNTADSIHFTHNYNNDYVTAAMVAADCSTQYYITDNRFVNIKCYSPAGGGITLAPIYTFNGGAAVSQNKIGDASFYNSIVNNTNAPTYGIACFGATAKIIDNIICRITGASTGSNGSVLGIYSNRGFVDSICRNTIFQLKTNLTNSSSYAPLAGMSINPDFGGGLANAITDNVIHSLHNLSASQGGNVAGIHVSRNVNIRRNFIHNLSVNDAAPVSVYGILVPDKESVVENNMISLGLDSNGNSITSGNLSFYGISGGHVVIHNSVYIGGSNVLDGFLGSACYLFLGNALPADYHNNLFVNARSNAQASSNAKHQCINIDLSYTGNHNMFYYSGNGGILGTYQSTRYTTLAQWQTGSSKDAASLFNDPLFVAPAANAASVNLHLSNNSPAESAGNGSFTVDVDFDNELRSLLTPVDMGADAGNYTVCPVAYAGSDTMVFEGSDVQLGSAALPGVSYVWTGPNGFTSNTANPIITAEISGTYVLTVSKGACSSSDSLQVIVMPAFTSPLCPGSGAFFVSDNPGASTFQWQVNTGSGGYTNIGNNANYSGTNNDTLFITNLPSNWYGYKYRCIANGIGGMAHQLQFLSKWVGTVSNRWGNPANWSCNRLPDAFTDVVINNGTVSVNQNSVCRTLSAGVGATVTVQPGITLIIAH